jgi:YgiT-type zinc finger domain-containing protein
LRLFNNGLPARPNAVGAGLEDEEKVKVTLDKRFKEAFKSCPVCGGDLVEKRVEKLLKGGTNTAAVEVDALVCLRCSERHYPEETVRRFEKIRSKLSCGETDGLTLVGNAYEVPRA